MKKLVNPLSTGGAPIYGTETFSEILTQEVWDAIEAIYGTLEPTKYFSGSANENIVLSGGVPTDVGGGDFDISAGIAYFPSAGGIIARFPAVASFTPGSLGVTYIELQSPVTEQKTFFDSTAKDYAITYSAAISASSVGSDFVSTFITTATSRFPSLQYILTDIQNGLESKLGDVIMRKYALPTWDMDTVSSYSEVIAASGDFIRKDKIISINAIIREDSTTLRQQFKIDQWGTSEPSGDIQVIENDGDNGFTVRLTRVTGEFFDGTRFNGTTDSRGYILIHYDNS